MARKAKRKTNQTNTPKRLPERLDLLNRFEYDPDTGVITNRKTKTSGHTDSSGYIVVYINGTRFKAHRIIYKMFHGIDPKGKHIDHRDGDKSNNRIENLRCVQRRTNLRNTTNRRNCVGLPKQDHNVHASSISTFKRTLALHE